MFKKKITSAMVIVSVIVLSIGSQAMASSKSATSGSVRLSNSQITPFASKSVGGGTWNYGTEIDGNQKHVWSIYDHDSKTHKASTKLGSTSHTSGWVSAGETATSEIYGNKKNTGYAYWNKR